MPGARKPLRKRLQGRQAAPKERGENRGYLLTLLYYIRRVFALYTHHQLRPLEAPTGGR